MMGVSVSKSFVLGECKGEQPSARAPAVSPNMGGLITVMSVRGHCAQRALSPAFWCSPDQEGTNRILAIGMVRGPRDWRLGDVPLVFILLDVFDAGPRLFGYLPVPSCSCVRRRAETQGVMRDRGGSLHLHSLLPNQSCPALCLQSECCVAACDIQYAQAAGSGNGRTRADADILRRWARHCAQIIYQNLSRPSGLVST